MMRKRLFSVAYMFGLTLFFTAVVSGVYELNRTQIEVNEEIKLQKIVLSVLGIDVKSGIREAQIGEMFENRVARHEREGKTVYQGFGEDGKTLIGYAFPLTGPGFWGPLYGIMAVDPQLRQIQGMAFYRHSETPGLGGRITEAWFSGQFVGKKIRRVGKEERHFSLVPAGTATAENEVDAITGATGTSRGVERLIDKDLKDYVPWIAQQRAKGLI